MPTGALSVSNRPFSGRQAVVCAIFVYQLLDLQLIIKKYFFKKSNRWLQQHSATTNQQYTLEVSHKNNSNASSTVASQLQPQ
jgi:hypothetical protein